MPKKILKGTVVSLSGKQSVVVKVRKLRRDIKYKKDFIFDKKYMAHDPEGKLVLGDLVTIEECPPISKMKKWMVIYNSEKKG